MTAAKLNGISMRTVALPVGMTAALMLTACGADGGGEDASAQELTVATAAQPGTPSAYVSEWFFDEVENRSDGRLTFDVLAPDSLCDADEIAECTKDGRADVGMSIPDYTPQMFPSLTVVSIPFTADDSQAVMQSLHQVNNEHEGAQRVWEQNGLVPISHWPVGRLLLGSSEPVENVADMEGQRWRVSGPYLQSAVETAGGDNVALTAPETYEGIERGVADGVGFAIDGATEYKLMELLPYWTDPGTGHYSTFGLWMNQGIYDGLDEEARGALDEVTEELNSGEGVRQFAEGAKGQCDRLLDSEDVEGVDRWDEEATEEWSELVGDDLQEAWVSDNEGNLDDAAGYLESYTSALESADEENSIEDPMIECVDRALEQ
ncbi:TRAP transporter substrate-binding protein [Halostreptopolyspora alba]|uniref:C4-dicarboxylate ABC transporter substrate-binding protein n=1 Tax=Halostreptopolyspora alba TaxID=2487137 RepID=A0A3N0EC54_9ACTN|nr:hypothetical protein EFW17_09610 [Nocardiopsaceae bacterium YIM 96095]